MGIAAEDIAKSVAANRGVQGGKQNDIVLKFQMSDAVNTRVHREKQNDLNIKFEK